MSPGPRQEDEGLGAQAQKVDSIYQVSLEPKDTLAAPVRATGPETGTLMMDGVGHPLQ